MSKSAVFVFSHTDTVNNVDMVLCQRCFGIVKNSADAERKAEILACRCDQLVSLPLLLAKQEYKVSINFSGKSSDKNEEDDKDSGLGGDSPPPTPSDWDSSTAGSAAKFENRLSVDAATTHHGSPKRANININNSSNSSSINSQDNNFIMEKFLERLKQHPTTTTITTQESLTVPNTPFNKHRHSSNKHRHSSNNSSNTNNSNNEEEERKLSSASAASALEEFYASRPDLVMRSYPQNQEQQQQQQNRQRQLFKIHSRVWKWFKSKTKSAFGNANDQQQFASQIQPRTSTSCTNSPFRQPSSRKRPSRRVIRRRSSVASSSHQVFTAGDVHSKRLHRTTRSPPGEAADGELVAKLLEEHLKIKTAAAATASSATASTTAVSTARGSWADISIASAVSADRRSSANSAGMRCLQPPPLNHRHGSESGYHSTPSTPRCHSSTSGRVHNTNNKNNNNRAVRLARLGKKSVSVEGGSSPPPVCVRSQARAFMNWRSHEECEEESHAAREKRRQFHQMSASVFHEVVVEDDGQGSNEDDQVEEEEEVEDCGFEAVRASLGEWLIPHHEVTCGKRLVDGGAFGHSVHSGRWHGDAVVHHFQVEDRQQVLGYLRQVRQLTQVRHENLVLYMGAAVRQGGPYSIVTNPVTAESLHSRLSGSHHQPLDVEFAVTVAKQISNAVGYLHAKDIVHGRISSRNVFLEKKVQLSLLDYAVGARNVIYSSPQVLSSTPSNQVEYRGSSKSDDVFAFGTLLFELFTGRRPLCNCDEAVQAARIRQGALPVALEELGGSQGGSKGGSSCAERLVRLVSRCWELKAERRPPFAQMVPHFSLPGAISGLLLRRHSTSEPRLDQITTTCNNAGGD